MTGKQVALCMMAAGAACAIYLDPWVGGGLLIFGFLIYKIIK